MLLPEGPGVDLAHVLRDQVVEAVEAEAADKLAGELNAAHCVAQRVQRGGPGKGKKRISLKKLQWYRFLLLPMAIVWEKDKESL